MIRNPGLLLALGSPLAYSLQNVWMRFQLDGSVTVWGLLLMRGLLGLAAMGLAARLLKKGLPSRNRRRLLLTGLSSYLSTICIILAIGNIPLYQALVLLYLYPALSVPLNYFLNGAPVRRATVFWVVTAFVGSSVSLIAWIEWKFNTTVLAVS